VRAFWRYPSAFSLFTDLKAIGVLNFMLSISSCRSKAAALRLIVTAHPAQIFLTSAMKVTESKDPDGVVFTEVGASSNILLTSSSDTDSCFFSS